MSCALEGVLVGGVGERRGGGGVGGQGGNRCFRPTNTYFSFYIEAVFSQEMQMTEIFMNAATAECKKF